MTSNRSANNIPHFLQTMEYGEMLDKADLAMAWLSGKKFGPFINGKWTVTNNEKESHVTEVHSPNTYEVQTTVTDSTVKDVITALQLPTVCENPWLKLSGHERNRCLYRIGKQLQQNSQLISELAAVSMGTQIRVTRDWDVPLAASLFMYYSGWAQLMEPRGKVNVTAAIVTSAACPLAAMAWLIAPVLAAGGTVCLKPSQRHPLLAFLLSDICVKAGIPAGVMNVLPGASDVGDCLVRNSVVNHIGFFGSTSVGRNIRQNVSGSSKIFNMLVDSKSAMIVFDTADLNSAVEEVVKAAWCYQGQVPWSVKNLLVQESVLSEVVKKLESRISTVSTGSSLNKLADIGPAVKRNVQEEVNKLLSRAQAKGLQVIKAKCAANEPSTSFFTPAVLLGTGAETNTVLSNSFCTPVLTVTAFRTAKEAITLANNSLSGLSASVWTENITLAFDVAKKLEVGIVWLNSHGDFYAGAPFTPCKNSGHGSFGGKEGLLLCKMAQEELESVNENKMDNIKCGCSVPIANSGRNDVRHVIDASLNIKNSWQNKTSQQKTEILRKWTDLILSRTDELIRKTNLSEYQLSWCAERLAYWAAICGKQQLTSSACVGDKHVLSYKEPLGIVAAVISHGDEKLAVDILASSICFGNVIVLASCSLLLLEMQSLLQAAGVPRGAITVLTGNEIVAPLAEHQAIDAIWYRKGNAERGQLLNTAAGWGMKRMWEIPSEVSQEMWEYNSTISKTIWITASEGLSA